MAWWIWMIIALLLGIVELMTTTFVLMWIGVAGVVTAVLTAFVPNLSVQVAVFAVVSAILLASTRPLVKRWRTTPALQTAMEQMVGKTGIVVTPPESDKLGMVRVQGELWSAQAQQRLQAGNRVVVTRADNAVLHVELADADAAARSLS